MASERVCYFGGETYSHGAKVCTNGMDQQCRDGIWIDTGNTCVSRVAEQTNSNFIPADEIKISNKFEGFEIDSNLGCAGFSIIHEASDYINLLNRCRDLVQIGISWSNSQSILYYRMPGRDPRGAYIARQILIRGISGRIVSAGEWDLRYGEDVTGDARIIERPMGNGSTMIGISNPSSRHMAFRVDIFTNGNFDGYSTGVTERGQDADRVESRGPGENKKFIIRSAYLDPE